MATIARYESMKPSWVSELGEVPAHWEVAQLGRIGRFSKGNGGSKEDEVSDGIPCVRYGDLYTRHRSFITDTKGFVTEERARDYTPIFRGDVLFAGSGESLDEIGKSAVNLLDVPARCGGDILVWRPSVSINPRFAGYVADSAPVALQKSRAGRGFTVMHIYGDDLKYVAVPVPPIEEQEAIVRFLDHADERIRRYIRAKQKLIKLLEEHKQAIIHRAVTRGLDPNVPLKPSGIDWLGDIPAHWVVKRAKFSYREVDERSATGLEEVLSVSHITGVTPRAEKNVTMFEPESYVGHKLCRKDDLVINTMWAWAGALGCSRGLGLVSPSYAVYRPLRHAGLVPDFVDALLRLPMYVGQFLARSTGIRKSRLRLYPEEFLKIPLLQPPMEEQRAITEHVSAGTRGLRAAIGAARREIELAKELRLRLEADAVTGRVDVREARLDRNRADIHRVGDTASQSASVPQSGFSPEAEE